MDLAPFSYDATTTAQRAQCKRAHCSLDLSNVVRVADGENQRLQMLKSRDFLGGVSSH